VLAFRHLLLDECYRGPGFTTFGQVFVLFKMVWQRYSLKESCRKSKRLPLASSWQSANYPEAIDAVFAETQIQGLHRAFDTKCLGFLLLEGPQTDGQGT
jgi:hypothetical protein